MIELIRQRLETGLAPVNLRLVDESAQHAGHAGARNGGGHYRLYAVTPRFDGLSRLGRHRLVYDLLDDLMQKKIHALTITTLTPAEEKAGMSAPAND